MTNKPTWEDELRKGWDNGKLCWNGNALMEISYERVKDFISTKLAERDEQWSKWKVLAEAMDNAPVGHRVTIKHLLGEDEWTLTRRNKTN